MLNDVPANIGPGALSGDILGKRTWTAIIISSPDKSGRGLTL